MADREVLRDSDEVGNEDKVDGRKQMYVHHASGKTRIRRQTFIVVSVNSSSVTNA